MYHDDSQKGITNSINRKQPSTRQNENRGNTFNSGNSYGNSSSYNSYNGQPQNHGQPRRRPDSRFKQGGSGGSGGNNEKLIKQNDLIIKLLKEIRDRLPAPEEKVVLEPIVEQSKKKPRVKKEAKTENADQANVAAQDVPVADEEDVNFNN